MANTERQAFIDWMKALGMLLIVTGHVIGSPHAMFNEATQPIYTKQLGVAFFIFIMGWGLAKETGDWPKVLFKRLFQIYFYGVACAVILSVIFWFTKGDINESNYLPFFGGVNVFFNYFPANPTTWYIGTYLHVLLFWAWLMRGKAVTPALFGGALVFEIVFRSVLVYLNKDFTAYMMLPNWLSVFLLGMWLNSSKDKGLSAGTALFAIPWVVGLLLWSWWAESLVLDKGFPFRSLSDLNAIYAIAVQSCLVSFVYIINTLVCFQVVRRLFHSQIVQFFSRNTLLVFIIHMPVIFAFSGDFYELVGHHPLKRVLWVMVLFIGLSLISEVINRTINTNKLRAWCWSLIGPRLGSA